MLVLSGLSSSSLCSSSWRVLSTVRPVPNAGSSASEASSKKPSVRLTLDAEPPAAAAEGPRERNFSAPNPAVSDAASAAQIPHDRATLPRDTEPARAETGRPRCQR